MSSRKLLRRFSSSISDLLSISRRDLGENEENNPLHNAVKMGNTVMAKNFMDSKSVWIDEPDCRGQTPLHLSITYGDTEMTSILLKGGANVDAVDQDGISSCHIACRDGMIDHFNLLIYYHADICSVDRAGRTPFDLACEHGQEKMLERLFNCGVMKTNFQAMDYFHTASALHLAAETGQVQVVSLLLHNHWDKNFKTESGSALHLAAGNGQIQCVRLLLRLGIDSCITNSDGLTAYAWAKKNSCRNPITYKEIRFLLKNFHSFTNAIAITDYCGVEANELSLSKGDKVWVIERGTTELWKGLVFGRKGNSRGGYFKSNVVEEEKDSSAEILTTPKIETRKNISKMSSRIVKNQKNPTSTFSSKPVSLPAVPRRSCSTLQYHDSNRNTPTQNMTSFGRTTSCYGDSNNLRTNNMMTKSTSGSSFGSDSFQSFDNSRSSTPNPSTMYSSSSCLYPNKLDNHYVSIVSSSSHSSSGFESAKFSASTSASSFPSTAQSTESGCESAHSVRSVESGSGSSSSIHGLDDSYYRSVPEVDVSGMVQSGVPHAEILANWLDSINMSNYLAVFLKQGYDLQTIARCTPADLLSVGIKNPDHRKKLICDIQSWKIIDKWPSVVPNNSLREWLHAIALAEYIPIFENQRYSTVQDILDLQWEDFEDIGVKRLGHLKRFGLTIKKLKDHQRQNSSSLHPSQYTVQSHASSYHAPSTQMNPQSNQFSTLHSSKLQRQPVTSFRYNDPPPPAPSAPNRTFRASSEKIDYLSYQQDDWRSTSMLSEAPKSTLLLSKPKSTSDLLFGDDTPIRLNLVSTGKILSDISKLKKEEEEERELEDSNGCPPPPAPLHCKIGVQNKSSGNLSSFFNSSPGTDQFPFANENCGTIRYSSGRPSNPFNVPTSLPPLLSDDHASDQSSIGSAGKQPTIDEMLQDIQGAMDDLISPPSLQKS